MNAKVPAASTVMNSTLSTTATVSLSTAGGIGVLNWILECVSQRRIVQPDPETSAFMVGLAAPVIHAARNAVVSWLSKKTGITIPETAQSQEQAHA